MQVSANPFPPIEEVLHGVTVLDPYRWLESRDAPQTEGWLREQSRLFHSYFDQCADLAALRARVQDYLDVEVVDQPAHVGDRYFYRKRNKGQEQGSIYVCNETNAEERLLVSPAHDDLFSSVGIYRISEDGNLLAYEVKHGGEDRKDIHIIDIKSGKVLPDTIPHGHARGFAFTPGGDGYLYVLECGTAEHEHRIRRHRFGQTGDDEVVFRVPQLNGSRLILTANAVRLGAVWFHLEGSRMAADLSISPISREPHWRKVFRAQPMPYNPILCHDRILVLTETESGDSQIVELSEDGSILRTLIPPRSMPICHCAITRDRLFVRYLDHGATTIESWNFEGCPLGSIEIQSSGTIALLPAHSQNSDNLFYSYQSYDCPPAIFEYSIRTDSSVLWHHQGLPRSYRPSNVSETTFTPNDGTPIPITLVSKERESPFASQPAIMTSYGGFGMAMTPQFSVLVAIMLELGAVFVLPHVRGGGEFGKAWHEAGRGRNKQRAFDDFIAAAEWLQREGITTREKLAIFGGSNSGLLVAGAMTQRPDLFAAVLSIAPLTDMVRYEQFDDAAKWRGEFGTAEDHDDFRALYSYSPYHRVRAEINYPATLFVSGDRDERCNPAHVRKIVALLQQRAAQFSRIILDYCEERGHSSVLPLSIRVEALARRIAFLCRELHVTTPEGVNLETSCG
jgi:prolyl oligopeptidase